MQVGTPEQGRYKAIVSSDDKQYGGQGRIDNSVEHFTHPEGTPGTPNARLLHCACLSCPSEQPLLLPAVEQAAFWLKSGVHL